MHLAQVFCDILAARLSVVKNLPQHSHEFGSAVMRATLSEVIAVATVVTGTAFCTSGPWRCD